MYRSAAPHRTSTNNTHYSTAAPNIKRLFHFISPVRRPLTRGREAAYGFNVFVNKELFKQTAHDHSPTLAIAILVGNFTTKLHTSHEGSSNIKPQRIDHILVLTQFVPQ